MKKINLFLLSALMMLIFGCNKDEQVVVPEFQSNEIQIEETQTAYSRALDNAFDLMQELYPDKHKTLLLRKSLLKPEYYTTATLVASHPEVAGRMLAKSTEKYDFSYNTAILTYKYEWQ